MPCCVHALPTEGRGGNRRTLTGVRLTHLWRYIHPTGGRVTCSPALAGINDASVYLLQLLRSNLGATTCALACSVMLKVATWISSRHCFLALHILLCLGLNS